MQHKLSLHLAIQKTYPSILPRRTTCPAQHEIALPAPCISQRHKPGLPFTCYPAHSEPVHQQETSPCTAHLQSTAAALYTAAQQEISPYTACLPNYLVHPAAHPRPCPATYLAVYPTRSVRPIIHPGQGKSGKRVMGFRSTRNSLANSNADSSSAKSTSKQQHVCPGIKL